MKCIKIICGIIFISLPCIQSVPPNLVLSNNATQNMNVDKDCTAKAFLPNGYEAFGDHYYKYHRDPKNIVEAMRVCEAEEAHISIINSDEEAAYIMEMMEKFPNDVLVTSEHKNWILMGFHAAFIERQYLTMDGKALESSGYVKWGENQPNGGNNNCGAFGRRGLYYACDCNMELSYICERRMPIC